jgi:hypothetical protein
MDDEAESNVLAQKLLRVFFTFFATRKKPRKPKNPTIENSLSTVPSASVESSIFLQHECIRLHQTPMLLHVFLP